VKLQPSYNIEYTLPYDLEGAKQYLSTVIKPSSPIEVVNDDRSSYLFNGVLKEDSFSISLKVEKSQAFLPLVNGRLIPYENKCLVLCTLSMFSSTKLFYTFWLVVTVLAMVILATVAAQPNKALIAFFLLVANIVITNLSFDHQAQKTRKALESVFSTK
jgi:hypothetical protein